MDLSVLRNICPYCWKTMIRLLVYDKSKGWHYVNKCIACQYVKNDTR